MRLVTVLKPMPVPSHLRADDEMVEIYSSLVTKECKGLLPRF